MNDSSDDDDAPVLSDFAAAALAEFLSEQKASIEKETNTMHLEDEEKAKIETSEDWQLSQFWYDDATCKSLETIVKGGLKDTKGGNICCISSPTLFKYLVGSSDSTTVLDKNSLYLLEYDKRFASYENFHFWDFNDPLNMKSELKGKMNIIIADPPFLSEDCFTQTALAIRWLGAEDAKIIFCTGAIQEDTAKTVFPELKRQKFIPRHKNNLSNDFACFSNFDVDQFL